MSTKFMSIIRVTKKYTVIFDFRALRGLRGRFLQESLVENAAFCNKKSDHPPGTGSALGGRD